MSGLATGFDVVMGKRAADTGIGAVLVAGCGLGVVTAAMRPAAMHAVQTGGALVSPFGRSHGPFAHDEIDRARVMAALAPAVVFGGPDGGPEMRALSWPGVAAHPAVTAPDDVPRLTGTIEADADRLADLARRG